MHRLVIVLCGLFFMPLLSAQVEPVAQALPTAAEVEAKIKDLKSSSAELSAEQAAAVANLEKALADLRGISRLEEALTATQERVQAAPAKIKQLQELQESSKSEAPTEPLTIPSDVKGLESQVDAAKANADAYAAALTQLLETQEKRSQRIGVLPKQIAQARQALDDMGSPAPGVVLPTLEQPRKLKDEVHRQSLRLQLEVLEAELASYQSLSELLTLQIETEKRKKLSSEKIVKQLESALGGKRQQDAEKAKSEAADAIESFKAEEPELANIAESNRGFATEQQERTKAITDAQNKLRDAKAKADKIESWARDTRTRIEAGGLTDGIGFILRGHMSDLPSTSRLQRELSESGERISQAQIDRIEYEKAVENQDSIDEQVEAALSRISSNAKFDDNDKEFLSFEAQKLRKSRADLLDNLIKLTEEEVEAYVNLDVARRTLLNSVESYREFIDERVLWIRSAPRMWEMSYHPQAAEGLAWLVDPTHWSGTLDALWSALPRAIPTLFWLLLGVVIPLFLRRRMCRHLTQAAELARRGSMVSFRPTFSAFLATLLLVIPVPVLLLCLSALLKSGSMETSFAHAVGMAFRPLAFFTFFVAALRWLAVSDGLGDAHFKWPRNALALLRSRLPYCCWVLAPLLFLVALIDAHPSPPESASTVGPIALLGCFGVLLWMVHLFLSPSKGLFSVPPRREQMNWHWRFRSTWYFAGFVAVVALAVLLVLGYQYSVMQIVRRFQATLALTIGLSVIHALNLRAVTLARRKLSIQEAQERKEAEESKDDEDEDGRRAIADQDLVDVEAMNAQTRQFLRTIIMVGSLIGIWFIWVDMFPALGFFDRIPLWTMDDGTQISLFHFFVAIIIFVMTLLAAKNLPGLLEFTVLRRLPIDPGVRYAISTVSRYLIVLIGVLATFSEIGIGWSKVQWLAAGISVGLGFGLQEIFANFVAGIIILFERPVRIGDMVTVSGTTGHITRIRIRATTISTLDHKELVVPNKEFITNQITNWTLSDSMNRWTIRVGIAYGSNVVQARRLLLKAARDNQVVLDEPKPQAIFMEFGDSALIFDLRVFIAEYGQWPRLMNSLHMSIDRLFREAGIEISFPQRDLHIRSAKGLEALVVSRPAMESLIDDEDDTENLEPGGDAPIAPEMKQ